MYTTTLMNLEGIMLNKTNQSQKGIYCVSPLRKAQNGQIHGESQVSPEAGDRPKGELLFNK